MMSETSNHVPKTEKRCLKVNHTKPPLLASVTKDNRFFSHIPLPSTKQTIDSRRVGVLIM